MIDPGHTGQTDPGVVAGGLHEADTVLDIALRLRERMAAVPGLQLRLTRELSRDLARPYSQRADLRVRTGLANAWPADFFLSLHVNGARRTGANGIETFTHIAGSAESRRVAAVVHEHLVPLWRTDRGLKRADFFVLRETTMPAVLVELGFLTNNEDRELLSDPAFRNRIVGALKHGLVEAFDLGGVVDPAGTPIIAPARATVGQARAWARRRGATEEFIALADLYWELGPQRGGVEPAAAYAQAAKETGFGRFGGAVTPEHRNPCGLKTAQGGANDDPDAHQRFATWRDGVTAHLDHLALYAGAPGYPRPDSPDPRHFAWLHGRARTVEALGGNWAPSDDYGRSIVRDYLADLLATEAPQEPEQPEVDWRARAIAAETRAAKAEKALEELTSGIRRLIGRYA